MAMLEQERGAVFFRCDRKVDAGPDDLEVGKRELYSARRASIGANRTGRRHRGFLGELPHAFPERLADLVLGNNYLEVAGPVAQHHETDFSAEPGGHHPTTNGHGRADPRREISNADMI